MSFLNDFTKRLEPFLLNSTENLPKVPSDVLDWIEKVRPMAEGKPRVILPCWKDIYNDPHINKMIIGGRQIFKSTYTTDVLACESTSKPNIQLVYVTYDDVNKAGFSRQKLQIGTFDGSAILKQFPRNRLGNVGEISLKNGSTLYITTDHGQYHHVEGKSADHVMLDEAQYQDMQYFERVRLTMTMTQGKLSVLGIGGEEGSPYHDLWLKSDQREWQFDDPFWREKLKFGWYKLPNGVRKWGLIQEDYLLDVCKGRWKVTKPENTQWHGYHVPQELFPQIPDTMAHAADTKMYNTDPTYSLEWKEKYMPYSLYMTHVVGGFFHGLRRPITRRMVEACMIPHPKLNYLRPEEIAEIKAKYGDKCKIVMGVDFGSGRSSQTVIIIMVKYFVDTGSKTKAPVDKVQLVHFEPRPAEDQRDQAEYITKLFQAAKVDVGVGDLGYGAIQVKTIQGGGANRITGELFEGVTGSKFFGSRTHGDETKPLMDFVKDIDEHGERSEHIKIDKTTAIQHFVDFLNQVVVDPDDPFDKAKHMPVLMIPNSPECEYKNIQIIKDWTSLTRKDLPEDIEDEDPDPRQKARKEFNHPQDSLAAMVLGLKAFDIGNYWNVVSSS